MRRQNSEFLTVFTSEASRKIKNTDFFGFVELDKFACYVIADGIDDNVDAISAKLAVDTVVSAFMESPSMSKWAVGRYLRAANRALLTARSKMKLKASVTVLVTNYVKLRYGQAGNTRFRLYRDGFLRIQSQDSSLSMDMVREERLDQDKLAQHEERHNLFCYLGQEKGFSPYISKKFKLSNSDAAALYTRGIWENVDEGELKDVFTEATDEPQPIVDSVEDMLLSRQPEGLEKYTFATIFFNKIFSDPNRKRKIRKILMIVIPILLVLAILTVILLIRHNNRKKDIAAMEQSFYDAIEYIQADNYPRAKTECQNALDLANKLKNKEVQNDASNYMKLIESVMAGDTDLHDGEYRDAQRNYLNAQNRSRHADNLGLDYIQGRLEQTGQYITVHDLIALGDTLVTNLQYDKAEEQYSAAQLLAGSIYFTEGRDSAIAALERLYESMKQDQADNETAAQQESEAQVAAAGVLSEGDAAFAKGDYTSALTYYTTSLQKYTELEDEAQAAALRIKIAATEEKLAAQQELAAEAEKYMSLAEAAYGRKNYVQAKKYYLLAKDVYSNMQNNDKVAEVSRKMELVEIGIVDFEGYASSVRYDYFPLWNLAPVSEKTSTYPEPCMDRINYDHRIFAHRLAQDRQYLVANTDMEITNVRRLEGDLFITCPEENPRQWMLYRVDRPSKQSHTSYPVLSNLSRESFAGNLSDRYRRGIKTKAEISRILAAYSYEDYVVFQNVALEPSTDMHCQTYPMDDFIWDELRTEKAGMAMTLTFSSRQPDHFLTLDIMSFLVSQVQSLFPEYICQGKLI